MMSGMLTDWLFLHIIPELLKLNLLIIMVKILGWMVILLWTEWEVLEWLIKQFFKSEEIDWSWNPFLSGVNCYPSGFW